MRFMIGNVIYEFKLSQNESEPSTSPVSETSSDDFLINIRYRKFQAPARSPVLELRRSLQVLRTLSGNSITTLMDELLNEYVTHDRTREDMVSHSRFYLERLCRRNTRRRGIIPVMVTVDEKVISLERTAEIQRRMESGRREHQRMVPEIWPEMSPMPAKKSVVEGLKREIVESDEENECAICLERFGLGMEVIRMPCMHVYHKDCILQWLEKSHFCPFCRFKLPSS